MESSRETILKEITSIRGPKKENGVSIMIRCPFHADKSPSCGIFTGDNGKIPLGYFSCFGCGEKGVWNKLARKMGLARIKEWTNYKEAAQDLLDTNLAKKLLGTETNSLQDILKTFGDVGTQPWPPQLDWRGYKGTLLKKLGGLLIDDNYSDNIALFLPVTVRKEIVGGFKALLVKEKGKPSYFNSRGDWIKSKGLFPYDLVAKMISKNDLDFVVLVEGPRDALRLIVEGIPALAVLGAKNFGSLKGLLVASLAIEKCFILTDNDDGGDVAYTTMLPFLKPHITTKRIKIPKSDKKIDPGNMPQKMIDKLKTILTKESSK
jgi:DNA primase